MGGVRSEKGVLKLVYPGGSVEIHKEAITAAEVMKRNPRHCVTRPDVFEYPWIVVRPESILSPGRVFFVVPYHTIRRLLQSNGIMSKSHSTAKQQKLPPKEGHNGNSDIGLCKQTLPKETDEKILYEQHEEYGCQLLIEPIKIQSRRRKTVSCYEYEEDYERRRHVNSFDNLYNGSKVVMKVPKGKDQDPTKVVDEQKRTRKVRQEERKKQYPIEDWPLKKIPSTKTYPTLHENRLEGSTFVEERVMSFDTKENPKFHKKNCDVTNIKSCLKKHGISVKKNVRFEANFIPGDDDE